MGKCYNLQESRIAKEAKALPPRPSNIITAAMVEEDVASFAAYKKRISDYLLEGVWHEVKDDGSWHFMDGQSVEVVSTMVPMHFRYDYAAP